jgi:EAL domain-containing protein (putative c-di-GMP-specific phosphodiesterase class I)
MRSGRLIGAEALIRWQHPQKGLLLPDAFLPVTEDHPLAVELGEWVIDTALRQIVHWRAAGLDIPVSVNIGARQLQQADFVARLQGILAAHPRVRAGDLELEVLETSALEDLTQISRVIEACGAMGVLFALDDFGTGYSSLTYLKRLPVNQLKIDQSFVRDMLDDPDDLAILEGVLGLARAFRRQLIAEGVETVAHGELLLQLGCELAQGYGIAPPMPADELPAWAASWRPHAAWVDLAVASRDDLPLLFSSTEHRAWVNALEIHLRDPQSTRPPLDIHRCRFGVWLDTEGRASHGAHPAFPRILALHEEIHALAQALCAQKTAGEARQAPGGVDKLHTLRDELLEELKTLRQNKAN